MELLAQAVSCIDPHAAWICLRGVCPHLMHLALDFCSIVHVSIRQVALSFPEMVNVKYLPFVYPVRENSGSEKPNH